MRLAPTTLLTGSLIDFSASEDYTSSTSGWAGIAPGTVINAAPTDAIDTTAGVPNWIGSEVVFAVNTSSSTFGVGRWVHLDKNGAILDMPATSGTGRPVYVCITAFSAGNTTTQGGWLMRSGICPALFSVAATAGLVYRGTAGNATPTQAAGAQILNATTLIAAATTFTRSVTTQTGSAILRMGRTNGLFPGQAITATGTSGLTVSAVNPDGTSITMSGNATATNTVTATFTPTGFGIVHIDRPFVQGQIL
jgi:hypothetical protein